MNIQLSLTLEHFRYLSSKQDGYPNSDVQPKGGSNLLSLYATVQKKKATALLTHFLPSMS